MLSEIQNGNDVTWKQPLTLFALGSDGGGGSVLKKFDFSQIQGGRTWQLFVGGKNGPENFRLARIYNFRDKCVVLARNLKFSKLTQ